MALRHLAALGLTFGLWFVKGHQEPLNQGQDDCHNTCTALQDALGHPRLFYNTLPPEGFRESYYTTRQGDLTPACIVQPSSSQDVSAIIQIINKNSCPFAVKSGGHGMFAGASNANGGITIDLKYLDQVILSEDEAIVSVGPGNRWGKVYQELEPKGLTVAGGRVSSVGVGGFMLGGGISFLSRLQGWASDNVKEYELIMANGSLANINYESHPELFWALRGGGPNFGVVTRYDIETYRQGPIWGGNIFYVFSDMTQRRPPYHDLQKPAFFSLLRLTHALGSFVERFACLLGRCTTVESFLQVMVNMALKGEADVPYMHLYMSFGYVPELDIIAGCACGVHTEPIPNPPAFAEFDKLVHVWTDAKVRNLTELTATIDAWQQPGRRSMLSTMTISVTKVEPLSKILDFWIEAVHLVKDIPGIMPSFIMQPLTQIARANRHKNGGSPFGILEADGPLIMLSIQPQWSHAEDDALVQSAFRTFFDKSIAMAKEMELHHPFIYQNYANISQDVFAGYGEGNRQKLRHIQKEYDPEGLFDKLQPGYFKI